MDEQAQKTEGIEGSVFSYLEGLMLALSRQSQVAGDPEYLQRQSGRDLAILHGAMSSAAFRLLAALEEPGKDEGKPPESR